MLYLDTSALLKLVVNGGDSAALRAFLAQHAEAECFSSMLAHAELLRAVQGAGAEATGVAREVLSRIHLVDVSRELLEQAATLRTDTPLCTADAIHLASAMVAGERLEALLSYDARRSAAAAAFGLAVATPRTPPDAR